MHPNIRFKVSFLFSLFWLLVLLGATIEQAAATHIRGGEITAHPDTITNNPLRYQFKLVVYTETARTTAENLIATLHFGTGESQVGDRIRYPTRDPDTDRNVYYFDYTYPAPGTYSVFYSEVNRQTQVVNIANSAGQSFVLRSTITIDPFLGVNSTPELSVPPIDYAACGQVFVHNPGAFDRDGDRLVYRLVSPLKNANPDAEIARIVPVDGYRQLNDPSICQGSANGGAGTLTLDPNTGQLTWDAPCAQGDYNVAFIVEEYRNGRKLGEVLRDMQIRVKCVPNLRPTLRVPEDICVIAGETVNGVVTASDPDNNRVILEAFSAFGVLPPATFTQNGNTGTFNWTTTCEDVLRDTVQVIFKVTDVPASGGTPLTDLQPWRIRIVGPPPQNFKVQPTGNSINLTWDPYTCLNAKRIAIYRREAPSDFVPGPCETGIPASAGFTRIGEVDLNDLNFTDTGGPEGFKRGLSYCYAIFAEFEGGNYRVIPGIATVPVCVMLQNNVPVITNVSVQTTDETNGAILVRWMKPREGLENLTAPQQYRLFRAPGASPTAFIEVRRTNDINDTVFVDSGISTTAGDATLKYIYKLEFYQNAAVAPSIVDTAATASSVQLKATTRATAVNLIWNYQVPWDNTKFKHYIYRKADAGAYALIDSVSATANAGLYTDQGTFNNAPLVPGTNYCYYVETRGGYDDPTLPRLLLNNSQEFCVVLRDSVPPCPPVLSIDPLDCESFLRNPTSPPYQNVLTWVPDQSPACDPNIAYFTIYFRPGEEGDFDSIAYTNGDINTYLHQNLASFAGCYTVTATDTAGNESAQSNIVCKDNCFFFQLPNIFTPNGDGKNDEFRPDRRSQFIRSVKFTVFTRWGDKVYESTDDPGINWKGVNSTGKQVSDGTYYYTAEVEFQSLSPQNAKQTFKGWVEIVR